MDFDCLARITNYRTSNIYSGYRPAHLIRDNYLTTGMFEFLEDEPIEPGASATGYVTFISPNVYPRTLFKGKKIKFYEGSRNTGEIEVIEIYNPILRTKNEEEIQSSFDLNIKLINSKTELDYRNRLVEGFKTNQTAFKYLKELYPSLSVSYVYDIVPDQGAEILIYVVDYGDVIEIEVDTEENVVEDVKVYDLSDFQLGLSKNRRIKLAVLVDRMNEDTGRLS